MWDGWVCVCVELGAAVPKSNSVPLFAAVATQGKTFRVRRNPGVLPSEGATCSGAVSAESRDSGKGAFQSNRMLDSFVIRSWEKDGMFSRVCR